MSVWAELKRRNVFRAAAAYVAVAWLLMQVAEVTFPAFGLSDRALRLLIIVLVIGFVPAVALAWVFEITPEGLKRERDVDRSGPLIARTNRLLDRAIVLLLGLGVTYFAVDKFLLDPARDEERISEAVEQARTEALAEQLGDKSIVVLPFSNLSSDPEQDFFADGMSEELLNLLARIPELRVISRSSAFAFKGRNAGLAEIAEALKVSHVLEGSVRRAGDRLRVTAQLVDARTDSHLWSETYDREFDDVFDIQDEIARSVVDALAVELLGTLPGSRRVDPQAYLLFMQARQMLDGWGDHDRIHELLQRALAIDPRYADAWTSMSWLYFRCTLPQIREEAEVCRGLSVADADSLSYDALKKALSIEPENATALAYRAWRMAFIERDWAGAAADFERAIAIDPTRTDVLRTAMGYARHIRRPDLAVRLGEFVTARDPLCSNCVWALARSYQEAGELDQAEATMRNFAIATNRGGANTMAMIRLARGDAAGAIEVLTDAPTDDHTAMQARAMAFHSLGREAESQAELARLIETGPTQYQYVAEALAWRGDKEEALAYLEKAAAESEPMDRLPVDWTRPLLRPLLETERGQAVLRQFNASDEQLAAIRFEPRLPGD